MSSSAHGLKVQDKFEKYKFIYQLSHKAGKFYPGSSPCGIYDSQFHRVKSPAGKLGKVTLSRLVSRKVVWGDPYTDPERSGEHDRRE
ncbi:hypothetical protein ACFLSA_03415 [Bacteroidota bacterium]